MPSFMTYDSFQGAFLIKPTNPATELGFFTIKGELTDSRLSSEFSFLVKIYNNPPQMKETIPELNLYLGTTMNYSLPKIEDEEGLPIKIQI
jgi:hypothetical protein